MIMLCISASVTGGVEGVEDRRGMHAVIDRQGDERREDELLPQVEIEDALQVGLLELADRSPGE